MKRLWNGFFPERDWGFVINMGESREKKMNIIVCIKEIPDPEIPPSKFKLDKEDKGIIPPEGIPPVINPYDEHAMELAMQLKEKHSGKITALTVGEETSKSVVKHALSMGADEGFLLWDGFFDGSESFAVAEVLSRAVQKIRDYDLVLCGRQAADWDEGLVGAILAEKLKLPLVTLARSLAVEKGEIKVTRITLEGFQDVSVPFPAVVTVSSEAGRPRLPTGWGIIAAAKKQIPVWNSSDISLRPDEINEALAYRKLVRLYVPEKHRDCEIIEEKTTSESAVILAERLQKEGVI
jgi:electron transfer flavoprotein beta subunit